MSCTLLKRENPELSEGVSGSAGGGVGSGGTDGV